MYTHPIRTDGFGAQYQTIIYSFVFSKLNGVEYVYTPFKSMEHNYDNDPEFLEKKEKFINFKSNIKLNDGNAKPYPLLIIREIESKIDDYLNDDTLAPIRRMFMEGKSYDKYFDSNYLNVAIHIRRPNKHDSRIEGADIPNEVFINWILKNYNKENVKIHIYSQGSFDKKGFEIFNNIEYHIDGDVEDVFTQLVVADVLLMSPSSLSYVAGLLNEGEVHYIPFWHKKLSKWNEISIDMNYDIPLSKILIENGVKMKDGKVLIPEWVKSVKLDIGLSYSAPISQQWLEKDENLMIFGFEPNMNSVIRIKDKNNVAQEGHGKPLENKYLNKNMFVIPIGLSNNEKPVLKDFFITEVDEGCSSLYKPKLGFRKVTGKTKVPIYNLKLFFDLFPWDRFEYIEYVKIDTQGNDLNIVKGMGDYIERVVFITLEAENRCYEGCEENNLGNMIDYFESKGFMYIKHKNTEDPTFVNKKYMNIMGKIEIYQKG